MKETRKGKIVVISGPSGVGKGTICEEVIKRLGGDVCLSISVTTRPQTSQEVEGEDYYFVSRGEFERLIEGNKLLEYAEVFGNFYGTPRDKVEELLQQGKTVILEIDVQGGVKVKKVYPDAEMIFIMPPSKEELFERISSRGRDDKKTLEKRLNCANREIEAGQKYYNRFVVNDKLSEAVNEVIKLIKSGSGEKR